MVQTVQMVQSELKHPTSRGLHDEENHGFRYMYSLITKKFE